MTNCMVFLKTKIVRVRLDRLNLVILVSGKKHLCTLEITSDFSLERWVWLEGKTNVVDHVIAYNKQ